MQTAADVTVIVVSYNTRDLTLAALRTLFDTTHKTALHVVVYDNASEDGSAEAIAAAFPHVELVQTGANLGFAKANNLAAAAAQTDWLLLLNPDTECHEGAVDALLDFAKAQPEAGIWGGRTVFADGSLNIASCWNRITPWSVTCLSLGLANIFPRSAWLNPEAIGGWDRDSIRSVDIVVGCFLLIRRETWAQLGGFDLKYYMYGEEADLCLRAKALGYRPMITPKAQIMHLVGASSGARGDKLVLVAQARVTLMQDHWPRWQLPFGVAMMQFGVALRLVALSVLGKGSGAQAQAQRVLWRKRKLWRRGYSAAQKASQ